MDTRATQNQPQITDSNTLATSQDFTQIQTTSTSTPTPTQVPAAAPKPQEKIALIYSLQDAAGQLIFKKIQEIGVPEWAVPYEFEEDIINVNTAKVKENTLIFLSKHASETGTKSLTVHMIGNFGEAKFGGKSRELSATAPRIGANYLRALHNKYTAAGLDKKGFSVSYEATHHGPFSKKNCVFIELGSAPVDWKNEVAAKVIAETVIEATLKENGDEIVIGLGGGHYCPDFTKLTLRGPFSFGHICPKHNLSELNKELLNKMFLLSGASAAILDWKGLKENKERVLFLCKKNDIPFERVQNLLK